MKNSYFQSHNLERKRELEHQRDRKVNIAHIWDRLAAFVVDMIILVLVTNLIFAPIKRKLQVAILDEHDGAAQIYFSLLVFGFVVLFLSYETLCVYFYKKTIGKKVFHVEVRSIFGEGDLSLGSCFTRALFLLFSILLFGFPFLQVFSHKLRRTMYDRVSDTVVCGLKNKGTSPDFIEKLWVKVVYAAVIVNAVIVFFVQLYFVKTDLGSLTEMITEPEYVCDEVSEAREFWPDDKRVTRLDVALAMFSAGEIGKECLELESQKYISFEQQLDKAYLAKAFAHEDKSQLSNEYLKKVCEISENSESCLLTKMISAWADKKWSDVDKLLADYTARRPLSVQSPFLVVWAIQHYDREQNYQKVLELADVISPNRSLNNFIGKYKTSALWNLDRKNEAEQLFQTTFVNMPKDSRSGYLADMCRMEVENNCQAQENKGCGWLKNEMNSKDLEFHSSALISLVKSQKCNVTNIDDVIARYENLVDDPRIELFLAAAKAQHIGKNYVAEQIYRNVLESAEEESYLSYEARSHLLEVSTNKKDLEDMSNWWIKNKGFNRYHQYLGLQILKTLVKEKVWDVALKVSEKMSVDAYSTPDMQKQMAVVFYKTNKMTLAKKMIDKIDSHAQARGIASEDEYSIVHRQLKDAP